jgi:hypothetical protein
LALFGRRPPERVVGIVGAGVRKPAQKRPSALQKRSREVAPQRDATRSHAPQAAKRAEKNGTGDLAETYYQLHDKLDACRRRSRCGSLACPRCARAIQKAKIAAQEAAITQASKAKSGRHLVFVTVVPKAMMYSPGTF